MEGLQQTVAVQTGVCWKTRTKKNIQKCVFLVCFSWKKTGLQKNRKTSQAADYMCAWKMKYPTVAVETVITVQPIKWITVPRIATTPKRTMFRKISWKAFLKQNYWIYPNLEWLQMTWAMALKVLLQDIPRASTRVKALIACVFHVQNVHLHLEKTNVQPRRFAEVQKLVPISATCHCLRKHCESYDSPMYIRHSLQTVIQYSPDLCLVYLVTETWYSGTKEFDWVTKTRVSLPKRVIW